MENQALRFGRRLLALAVLIGIAWIFAGTSLQDSRESGKARKEWSGISYADRTVVARMPSRSLAPTAFDSERAWSGYDDWEPAVAADPSSSYVYQLTTRYNGPKACSACPFPVMVFRKSSDGGATWSTDSFLPITKKKQNDPQIEVASDGAIYVVWLDDYNPGIKFTKSTNRGATWSTPIALKGKKPSWSDKPILAISSNGQHVYVAFNASHAYVVASHNYGQSFSAAVKTNNDTRYWFHSGGAVASNGDVYFAAADYSQTYVGDSHINVIRSTNAGSSWSTTLVDTSAEMPGCSWSSGCYFGFLGPSAALAIDSAGRVVLAYNAGNAAGAPQKMYVRNSVNGVNWSSRTELSNGSSSVNNAFPAAARGTSAGDFRVAWQDDRNSSTNGWNTWYRRTTDGGNTWSAAVRLSDLTSGAPYKTSAGYLFPYGDYFELAVDSAGINHCIWGEGASYDGPGGVWYTRGQ